MKESFLMSQNLEAIKENLINLAVIFFPEQNIVSKATRQVITRKRSATQITNKGLTILNIEGKKDQQFF